MSGEHYYSWPDVSAMLAEIANGLAATVDELADAVESDEYVRGYADGLDTVRQAIQLTILRNADASTPPPLSSEAA